MKNAAAAIVFVLVGAACTVENVADTQGDDAARRATDPTVDLGGPSSPAGGDRDDENGVDGMRASELGRAAVLFQRPDRFATKVVSFTPGPCAGFGQTDMPGIVLGPPNGGGTSKGSLDVVSLGKGGEIVLSFEPNAVVDGPGVDLLVFENAFYPGGDPQNPAFAEAGEVSVSDDGVTWTTFPCTATAPPYGECAGWHPVLASAESNASPLDPSRAGGDPYDLATIGVKRARFVRIKDKTSQRCTSQSPNTNGFDLDAIAAVHAEDP